MAIYHNTTKIISRSNGRSCVGASAYRSGEKLHNEYDDMTHDYTRKKGVVYKDVMLPKQVKEEFKNREVLWNEVEKIEKSKNSQLAREVEVAIPKELNREEQINLVRNYVKDNFVNNGMCADVCIHDKEDGNPHAHIMLTMRPIKENGEWGAKSKKEYILNKDGEKIKLKSGQYKSKKIDSTNWNTKEFLESYRKDWAEKINEELKRKGINERVDHRSYAEQGIIKEPTIHEGYIARKMETRGEKSDRMEINREVQKTNNEIEKLNKNIDVIGKGIDVYNMNEERKNINAETEKINEDIKNAKLIKEYEKSIENQKQQKSKLSIFNRSERKNYNDKISKLEIEIDKLKNKISTGFELEKAEKRLEHLQNRKLEIKMNIDEFTRQVEEINKQKEIDENNKSMNEYKERMQREEEAPQRIPMNFRERDFETEDNKKLQNKIQDVNTLEERKKLIKNAYLEVKLMGIEKPSLKKDPKYKEKMKELEGLMKKYDLFKELNKNKVKNKDIERSR